MLGGVIPFQDWSEEHYIDVSLNVALQWMWRKAHCSCGTDLLLLAGNEFCKIMIHTSQQLLRFCAYWAQLCSWIWAATFGVLQLCLPLPSWGSQRGYSSEFISSFLLTDNRSHFFKERYVR